MKLFYSSLLGLLFYRFFFNCFFTDLYLGKRISASRESGKLLFLSFPIGADFQVQVPHADNLGLRCYDCHFLHRESGRWPLKGQGENVPGGVPPLCTGSSRELLRKEQRGCNAGQLLKPCFLRLLHSGT